MATSCISPTGEWYVYRLYDLADRLLYVGYSNNFARRLNEHRKDKPWFSEVVSVRIERFSDERTARDAEEWAIRRGSETPVYNVVMNGGNMRRDLAPIPSLPSMQKELQEARDSSRRLAHRNQGLEGQVRNLQAEVRNVQSQLQASRRTLDKMLDAYQKDSASFRTSWESVADFQNWYINWMFDQLEDRNDRICYLQKRVDQLVAHNRAMAEAEVKRRKRIRATPEPVKPAISSPAQPVATAPRPRRRWFRR